jgi:hypothetical protein
MVTSEECFAKYGDPYKEKAMTLLILPVELQSDHFPKRIYCNKDMVEPLKEALCNLIDRNLDSQLKTWDGCFGIRKMRGSNKMSLHSWGIAIDVNASENPMGQTPKLSEDFVDCFTDAGFDWGGYWHNPIDGMHFQLAKI